MISQVVRDLRLKKGVPSRILANKVGKNDTWISQIETGKIKHPHLPSLKALLKLLDCTEEQVENIILNEFADLDENPNQHSKNRTDYKIERKVLLTNKERVNYNETEVKTFQSKVLTEKTFFAKCEEDAHQLYCEIKQLPKKTQELLINLLFEDL